MTTAKLEINLIEVNAYITTIYKISNHKWKRYVKCK